ncbi:MAG TPA: SpoIVB peptidase S55 domain-containing protein [Acidobacteriota bacterium]|nr:SpoIVB peptidase S55 domain-containing protein [Acidobacteriota bacterium]
MREISIRFVLIVLILSFFSYSSLNGQSSFFPINQIKEGMKGTGKTAFKGKKVEEFGVEILGILENDPSIGPKRNIILAKLTGGNLEKTGVVQGMSGSPIYLQGKLAGAVAYSFPFSTEAIAGITPIKEMMEIKNSKETSSTYSPPIPIKKHLSLEELSEMHEKFNVLNTNVFYKGKSLEPMKIPLMFSGFSKKAFEKSKYFFSNIGFNPMQVGSREQAESKTSFSDIILKEGDPVGVQMISGDLSLAATGTTTFVDGQNVLAFGHPMYNLGPVSYAMTQADVITVVPSLNTSMKLTSTGAVIGSFSQDRSSGVYGELGKTPDLIPVNIELFDSGKKSKDIHLEVVENKILTASLLNVAVLSIMSAEERSIGDLTVELSGDVFLENGMSIHMEDFFSGNFDSSINNASNLVAAITYFLTNNEFEELGIHRIDLRLNSSEEIKISYLEKVWLDKYDVSPGERIQIKIYSRNFRGDSVLEEGGIIAPNLPSGSKFYLFVGDTASMGQLERSLYQTTTFMPRSLYQLIRILSNQRKNNRIYLKILADKPGLFLKGEELPNLPPSMKSMFSSPRVATSVPTEISKSTLSNFQIPVPFVFQGVALIPIKIK